MDLTQYFDKAFWVLQAVVGLIFIIHSSGKIKNPAGIASAYGAPAFVGLLHGLVEMAGGILLIANFYVQYVGIVFVLIMLGAIFFKIVKWKMPFMAQNATGWEFDLVLLAANILFIVK